jgi:pimeloyl-ACP methyl ester carboxylesterase
MSAARINGGVELHYELSGSGEPLVLVHGSWGDHHNWDPVVPTLAESFQVLAYDRRGHSASERPAGQGSVFEDADDLAGLIDELGLAPAHVAGNSFGAAIALRAATRRPEVFRCLIVHEPPLFPRLAGTELEPPLKEVQRRIDAVVGLLRAAITRALRACSWKRSRLVRAPGTGSSRRRCARCSSPTRRPDSTRCAIPTPSTWTWTPWRASTDRRF